MSDHDQVFCLKLAKAVKKHPCLYNFNLPEYSNKMALEKAWEIIAKETGMSVINCKDKWRNIRTVFSRNLKRGRSGEVKKRPYYLREILKFLIPFVKASSSDSKKKPTEENGTTMQLYRAKDETREVEGDRLSSYSNSSDLSFSSNGLVSTSSTFPASTSAESQPVLLVVKPKEKSESGKTEKSKNEACSEFCNSHVDIDIADSPRKMFLLSLLSDVESMTDLQFRKFRREALSMIDNILLSNYKAQITPSVEKTSNVKIEMEVEYEDIEEYQGLSEDVTNLDDSIKIESSDVGEAMMPELESVIS